MTSGYSCIQQSYGVPLSNVPLLNGDFLCSINVWLYSFNNVLHSDSIAQTIPFIDFDYAIFSFAFRELITTMAMGSMQSTQILTMSTRPATVPEPSMLALLALGFAGLYKGQRKSKTRWRLAAALAGPENHFSTQMLGKNRV